MNRQEPPRSRPKIVVITPVYNESDGLLQYEERVRAALLDSDQFDFEVLFVEDGSEDGSWDIIKQICNRDNRFRGIRLSRNYGSHIALSAGFANARGEAIATLACDLQDPPEVVLEFLERWQQGARIVWGKRRTRQDKAWRVFTSNLFFKLVRRHAMPRGSKFTTGSFLLVDKIVAECFSQFQEQHRITFALVAWTGFEQDVVEYDRMQRYAGQSKWGFVQMMKTMYDAFIGFSLLPIRLITLLGASVSLLTFLLLLYLLAVYATGQPTPGWTSQMLALSAFFGIQFLMMGIVGEYLYRIYAEVVRRPLYFVSGTAGTTNLAASNNNNDRTA